MFINCSNHPSVNWTDDQKQAAKEYGEIIDIPFPNVRYDLTDDELDDLVEETVNIIMRHNPKAVMCMGEFVCCFRIVQKLKDNNIIVLASKTARVCKKVVNEDGSTTKTSWFDFKGFREY